MNVKNQKCIRKLSRRSLWASRKRNIIAIIAIALTALLFTSLFTIVMSLNSSYEMDTFRRIGGYCHGTFKEVTEEQIENISLHSNVKAVGKRINIGYMDSGIFAKAPAEVSFMDDNCTEWSFAVPTVGQKPQGRNEITMDTYALKLLGVAPELGAHIELTYTVGSLSATPYEKTDTFTLVGWWEYDDISPVHYINISEEYAKEIEAEAMSKGLESFRIDLNVMMASSINIRGQMEQVDLDLGYAWDETGEGELVRIGVNWGYTSSQLGESMDAATLIAIVAFLALVIFTGYLIIYNIFQISVTGDIRFYGLLKTIGVTPRQLRRMIRQQAMFLCIVGIPAGLLLGIWCRCSSDASRHGTNHFWCRRFHRQHFPFDFLGICFVCADHRFAVLLPSGEDCFQSFSGGSNKVHRSPSEQTEETHHPWCQSLSNGFCEYGAK